MVLVTNYKTQNHITHLSNNKHIKHENNSPKSTCSKKKLTTRKTCQCFWNLPNLICSDLVLFHSIIHSVLVQSEYFFLRKNSNGTSSIVPQGIGYEEQDYSQDLEIGGSRGKNLLGQLTFYSIRFKFLLGQLTWLTPL